MVATGARNNGSSHRWPSRSTILAKDECDNREVARFAWQTNFLSERCELR